MKKSIQFYYKASKRWQRRNSNHEKFVFDMTTNFKNSPLITKEFYLKNQIVTETVNKTNGFGPTHMEVFYEKAEQSIQHLGATQKNYILPVMGNSYMIDCGQQINAANISKAISDKERHIINRDYNYVNPDLWRELLHRKRFSIGSQLHLPSHVIKRIFYCLPSKWNITNASLTLESLSNKNKIDCGVFALVTQMRYYTQNDALLEINIHGKVAIQIATCWLNYLAMEGKIKYSQKNCRHSIQSFGDGNLSMMTTNKYF